MMPWRSIPVALALGLVLVGGLQAQVVVAAPSPSPSASASPSPLPIRGVTADTQPNPSGATHVERPPLGGGGRR